MQTPSRTPKKDGTKTFLLLSNAERHDANYLESGATRHISELPKKIIDIMGNHRTRIQDLFKTLDLDRNGEIEAPEFAEVLNSLGLVDIFTDEEVSLLFSAIDVDNDGSVTFEELLQMFHSTRRGKHILEQEDPAMKQAREDEAWAIKAAEAEAAEAVKAAARAKEEARLQREREEAEAVAAAEAVRLKRKKEEEDRRRAREAGGGGLDEEERARRWAAALAALPKHVAKSSSETSISSRPPWNHHVRPRVERSGRFDISHRAKPCPDARPDSVAYPHPHAEIAAHQRGSSRSLLPSASAATLPSGRVVPSTSGLGLSTSTSTATLAPVTTHATQTSTGTAAKSDSVVASQHVSRTLAAASVVSQVQLAYGAKRNLLLVQRLAPNHYTFTPTSSKPGSKEPDIVGFDAGPGTILDRDKVATAVLKLHKAFPHEVPLQVPWGSGYGIGATMRPVRHVLVTARNTILVEAMGIGVQFLRGTFNTICGPSDSKGTHITGTVGWG